MKWVHQEIDWPKHYWDDGVLDPILKRIHDRISVWGDERVKMDENRLSFGYDIERYLKLLYENAVITSKMEGAYLDSKRLYDSLKQNFYESVKNYAYSNHENVKYNEDGLAKMMLDANLNCWRELTDSRLFVWHKWLFPDRIDEHKQEIIVGTWRAEEIYVGMMKVYTAPAPNRVTVEMIKFLNWINDDYHTDALIKAGRAHLWFEQIHPFDNGNGRIGRAIMDMMLGRAVKFPDVVFDVFHSMTRQIGQEITEYYQNLQRHNESKDGQEALDITPWLVWFLECLERSMDYSREVTRLHDRKLQMLLHITSNEKYNINERQKKVIQKMLEFEWIECGNTITSAEYMEIAGLAKRDTAVKDIKKLRDQGIFKIKDSDVGKKKISYRLITWDEIREKDNLEKQKLKQRIAVGTEDLPE